MRRSPANPILPVMIESTHVLIAGGGVAGLEAALTLRELLRERVRLTLLSSSETFFFRALGVGEPFGLGAPIRHPLAPIARRIGADVVTGELAAVAPEADAVELRSGESLEYDRLLVAIGAQSRAASEYGVTYGHGDEFAEALADLQGGFIDHVAFVVPHEVSWPLPAYELALMTVAWGAASRSGGVRVTIVTPEREPLAMFGSAAAAAVAERLERAGVTFVGGAVPALQSDTLVGAGSRWVTADRVAVLPEVVGPAIPGLPERRGFIPVDAAGRVEGAPRVYAAGDAADHPVKQGGLAAQQATAAARAIALDAARVLSPVENRPILRGLLRTVEGPLYLRAALGDEEHTSTASTEPLWWPPAKLAAPRVTALVGQLERERAQGIVLPSGGLAIAAP
jgi:sulfide:quinone oxidoreductase